MKEPQGSLSSLLGLIQWSSDFTNRPVRIGLLACCEFSQESIVNSVRSLISHQHWERVVVFRSGDVTSDWIKWFVAEDQNGSGAVLEVLYPFDLYLDDSCHVLRNLTPDELSMASRFALEWLE